MFGFKVAGSGPIATLSDPVVQSVTSVVVSPATATDSQKFNAAVNGVNSPAQTVNWTATAGTIDAVGNFVKPAPSSQPTVIKIRATSTVDSTKFGEALVTIAAGVTTVTSVVLTPAEAIGTQKFSALALGDFSPPQDFTWSTTDGTVDANGNFVEPVQTYSVQLIKVRATSVFDPTRFGEALVTLPALVVIPTDNWVHVAANRILLTTDNPLVLQNPSLPESFYLRGSRYWFIDRDADDKLFYGIDMARELALTGTTIESVEVLVNGVTLEVAGTIQGTLVLAKIGGGIADIFVDTINDYNHATFRIVCANGERFDRSIYFNIISA